MRMRIADQEKLVSGSARVRDAAGAGKDQETQNLMVGRITGPQKTFGMLKRFLKD